MSAKVQNKAVKIFTEKWNNRGREDEDDRSFWIDLLQDVFGLTGVTSRIEFQKKVVGPDGNTKRIDAYIPETHVLIEQKSLNIQLDKSQAGHDGMTPYEQAKMYDNSLPRSEKSRWIITSNFAEIWVYDMEARKPEEKVIKIKLEDLERDYKYLSVLYDAQVEQINREFEISQAAGTQIGKIYDALLAQYPNKPTDDDFKNLNTFCVRLVFCFYAEDAGLFDDGIFKNYIESFNVQHLRNGLKDLFRILNTKENERDPFEEKTLLAFPYVNGGLFADDKLVIPQMNDEIKSILVNASDFDWSEISPTIFGAIFESTLNQETRRSGGMHYTSIENIHKVIDPLFLDDLKNEFASIKESKQPNVRVNKMRELQGKMATLKFFDPACGSGNFLTETYLSLRRLENDIISTINRDQIEIADITINPIKVQLNQFYGIEINDFAVSVAKTALWIAENQMMNKTKEIIYNADSLNFLPLKSYTNIVEGNALTLDWNEVISPIDCSYIIGNPPFVGFKNQTDEQRNDMKTVTQNDVNKNGVLDYVCGWYIKAARFIKDTNIECAFVSTNSITQGEQPGLLWDYIFKLGISINYAYRTFVWSSESTIKASVHCVIISFSCNARKEKIIYEGNIAKVVSNISPYLIDGSNKCVEALSVPICDVPKMIAGNKTVKCLALILSQNEKDELVKKEPLSEKYIKRMIGAEEFINDIPRYCLWLVGIEPSELRKMPLVMERVERVREDRLASKDVQAHALAKTPTTFRDTNNPPQALVVPLVSTERRKYIPIGYIDDSVIANNKVSIIPNGNIYHFGVLTSLVHNAWMRVVAMRMKSDYSYSLKIVYNTFPWPDSTNEQRLQIEKTAQAILDARGLYPNSSLADLYDPLTMPKELVKAHEANDKAVMKAYGFKADMTEADIVAELMKMYQKKIAKD